MSPRVRRLNSMVKKNSALIYLREPCTSMVLDNNDFTQWLPAQEIFAVVRPNLCRSQLLVCLLNNFGLQGGFELLLARVRDRSSWHPIDSVHCLLQTLEEVHVLFHREFAWRYLPAIVQAV